MKKTETLADLVAAYFAAQERERKIRSQVNRVRRCLSAASRERYAIGRRLQAARAEAKGC